jgi:hypothetical protein
LDFLVGIPDAYKRGEITERPSHMARKLYVFNPTGRVKSEGKNVPVKWLGCYSSNYAYLGDHYAKMLGVGNRLPTRRIPAWLQAAAENRQPKRGASRHDPKFRGWG